MSIDYQMGVEWVVINFGIMGAAVNTFVVAWFGRYLCLGGFDNKLHRNLVAANMCGLLANVCALPLHIADIDNHTVYLVLTWVHLFFMHFANAFFFLIVLHVEIYNVSVSSLDSMRGTLLQQKELSVLASNSIILFTAAVSATRVAMNQSWIVAVYLAMMALVLIRSCSLSFLLISALARLHPHLCSDLCRHPCPHLRSHLCTTGPSCRPALCWSSCFGM
jgi:hypothetical protein